MTEPGFADPQMEVEVVLVTVVVAVLCYYTAKRLSGLIKQRIDELFLN
ncbi:MAG TPA: hypothetical protein VKP65_03740 [Rhodothermales bacterium]|nr:hypothetical protein [Rhodothermales bacterium]